MLTLGRRGVGGQLQLPPVSTPWVGRLPCNKGLKIVHHRRISIHMGWGVCVDNIGSSQQKKKTDRQTLAKRKE